MGKYVFLFRRKTPNNAFIATHIICLDIENNENFRMQIISSIQYLVHKDQ